VPRQNPIGLEGGFARIPCPNCRAEHLLAFSCRTRNFCPSCQGKRSALFAEHVVTEILEPVPHRHVVLTIPRVLRGLFQRDRRSLDLLARAARTPPTSIPTCMRSSPTAHLLRMESCCSSHTSMRGSSRRLKADACACAPTAD